jgi:pantoate--beta-alanine ligase
MQIYQTRAVLQEALAQFRRTGKSIALVPTMGNLHAGHLALVAAARAECDIVLATIFINPLQFGPSEDLSGYPRTLDADIAGLTASACDAVFIPATTEMYPNGLDNQTLVSVPGLTARHCGASRPGHFDGVCTVVSKLLHLTGPDAAFFGEKDYQQLQVIRKMVSDLCMPVIIRGVPVQRSEDGLALSSRNGYLTDAEREVAPLLQQQLVSTRDSIVAGNTDYAALESAGMQALASAGFRPDYIAVCDAATLEPATAADTDLVILAAAWLGKTRLIDNITLQRA